MTTADETYLFDLLSTPSPTGFETAGQRKWLSYVKKYSDAVDSDTYGTAWATLKGSQTGNTKPKTVMLEAHADEIGFIVKHITKEGFLNIDRVGGSDVAVARGKRLRILTDKGEIPGVVGNTAIHIRDRNDEKVPKVHHLFVDIGAKDDKEVGRMGVRVGNPAVFADEAQKLGKNTIVSRALDNRLGSFIIAQVLKNLHGKRPHHTVYAVNAVQEEIGGYGAKMVTHRLLPSVALVLDVTHATDTPGIDKAQHGHIEMGKGPTVTHGRCNHPMVVERIMDVAKKKKIPLQHESSSYYSGTDTDEIYHVQEGIPSALISLPLRYMHSAVETVHLKDIQQTITLITEVVRSLKQSDDFRVKV